MCRMGMGITMVIDVLSITRLGQKLAKNEVQGWHAAIFLIMGNLLYVVAVILIIAWAIGFVGYQAGGIIHILLVIAVIAVILRVIQGRKIL